jgi:hypothetical protein
VSATECQRDWRLSIRSDSDNEIGAWFLAMIVGNGYAERCLNVCSIAGQNNNQKFFRNNLQQRMYPLDSLDITHPPSNIAILELASGDHGYAQ